MKSRFRLEEMVRDAHARTGIPGVAAGLLIGGETSFAAAGVLAAGGSEPVSAATPFRIASITKPFTATLCAETGVLDEGTAALLSHTAGFRPESEEPLPGACQGLWSYSNAGYWHAGARAAAAAGGSFESAMHEAVLDPFALGSTAFEEPDAAARGHVQAGESGHTLVPADSYPRERRPSGGLWSTVGDLVRFGERHLEAYEELHAPRADALGARYACGFWVRDLSGRLALDHEGSVAGYQSLLLLVPDEKLVLAVLTNSWRGSGLVRHVVAALDLAPHTAAPVPIDPSLAGTYALDDVRARVTLDGERLSIALTETEPVTSTAIEVTLSARSLGTDVFGYAGGMLQGHRLDFPRPDVARVGWTAMPRVAS
jgi:CubicO group peptidase (beta-lactamase class C family)